MNPPLAHIFILFSMVPSNKSENVSRVCRCLLKHLKSEVAREITAGADSPIPDQMFTSWCSSFFFSPIGGDKNIKHTSELPHPDDNIGLECFLGGLSDLDL